MADTVALTEKALASMTGSSKVFQRTRALVRILPAEKKTTADFKRDPGSPLIQTLNLASLRLIMARSARFFTFDKRVKDWVGDAPQAWVVESVQSLGYWENIVPLTGIITAPTMREDGTILGEAGYDEATGLFYAPGNIEFSPILDSPTKEDAKEAMALLLEPFRDFPFPNDWDRHAAVAAVLTVMFRHLIHGNVPLFGVNANTPGTGKGLLVDVIATIATGCAPARIPQKQQEEETDKLLFTAALEGDPIILIDNCRMPLGGETLELAITSRLYKSRLLGKNENSSAPQNAVYFATGNNLHPSGDMPRRVMPIKLTSMLERPDQRNDFQQSDLIQWVKDHRPSLVCAALTLMRAYYIADDKPEWKKKMGSFEQWSDTIRPLFTWLGMADPATAHGESVLSDDSDLDKLLELIEAWRAVYADSTKTTLKMAKQDIGLNTQDKAVPYGKYHRLRDALLAFDENARNGELNTVVIGKAIGRFEDRVVSGWQFVHGKKRLENGYPWFANPVGAVGAVAKSNPSWKDADSVSEEETAVQDTRHASLGGESEIATVATAATGASNDVELPTDGNNHVPKCLCSPGEDNWVQWTTTKMLCTECSISMIGRIAAAAD